jgi:WD40 repeat protein
LSFAFHSVRAWDTRMWGNLAVMRGHVRWVEDMALSAQVLVTASVDCTVRVWDTSSFNAVCTWRDHVPFLGCTFAGANSIVTCSTNGSLNEYCYEESTNDHLPRCSSLGTSATTATAPAVLRRSISNSTKPRWPAMPTFTSQKGVRAQTHRRCDDLPVACPQAHL